MFLRMPSHISLLALAVIAFFFISGCMREPARVLPPHINADSAGQEVLNLYDKNKDGKISGAELDNVPALRDSLVNFNSNKEKGLTAADIATRIKAWQESKVGIIGSVSCSVMRNNKPLAGAEVKFVPEKFLGNSFPVCTGTTGQEGKASISRPVNSREDPKGVTPGWYKVEIIKSGENIPAKYNVQTILGAEVAPDVHENSFKFEIK